MHKWRHFRFIKSESIKSRIYCLIWQIYWYILLQYRFPIHSEEFTIVFCSLIVLGSLRGTTFVLCLIRVVVSWPLYSSQVWRRTRSESARFSFAFPVFKIEPRVHQEYRIELSKKSHISRNTVCGNTRLISYQTHCQTICVTSVPPLHRVKNPTLNCELFGTE